MHNILLMVLINKILDFTNNRLLVGQTCDVIKFTHLIFQINEPISVDQTLQILLVYIVKCRL